LKDLNEFVKNKDFLIKQAEEDDFQNFMKKLMSGKQESLEKNRDPIEEKKDSPIRKV